MAIHLTDDLTGEAVDGDYVSVTIRYHHDGKYDWLTKEPAILKIKHLQQWAEERIADTQEMLKQEQI